METSLKTLLLTSILLAAIRASAALPSPAKPELVLREDTQLELANLTIVAGKGLARQYRWDGCAVNAGMNPRGIRWLGSLGMYDPVGGAFPASRASSVASCPGTIHMPVAEGQMHFADRESAEEWLGHLPKKNATVAWTNDGVVVSFIASHMIQKGNVYRGLSVNVSLVCIRGQRPDTLVGANDAAIKLTSLLGKAPVIQECAKVGDDVIAETWNTLVADWKKWGTYSK